MSHTLVRDLSGRPLFLLDEKGEVRDDSGKIVAERRGDDKDELRLAAEAAAWMGGKSIQGRLDDDGRKVLLDLSPFDVSTAPTSGEFGALHDDFVADRVSRVVYVKRKQGVFFPQAVTDAVDLPLPSVGHDGAPPELNPTFTSVTFTTVGYALAAQLPRQVVDNADFDLKRATLSFVVQALRLAREYRVAQKLTTAASFASGNQVAAGAKWNGGTNPAPLTDVFAALATSYLPANTIVLSENVTQYYYSQPTGDTANQLRDYVQAGGQLPTPIIARAKMKSGGNLKYVWAPATPANVPLVRVADPDRLSTSLTFRWLGDGAPSRGERISGMWVRQFYESRTDSHWIVCAHDDAEQILHNQVGSVITGALA